MSQKNVLLTIEYDGTRFSGWQRQPNVRTVQGLLEETLSRILNQKTTVDGTSRTDAGVHALGQRATFSMDSGLPVDRLPFVLNHVLRGRTPEPGENSDLRIVDAVEVSPEFHARYQCVGKTYVYRVYNAGEMPVFMRNYRWNVERPLDIGRMNEAAEHLVGTHDFQCFQAAGSNPRLTTVRTIYGASVYMEGREDSGELVIEVTGDGFLYNMVRIIAGTLVEVGLGRMESGFIREIISGKDRSVAGPTAPPQGLYLKEIYYDRDRLQLNAEK